MPDLSTTNAVIALILSLGALLALAAATVKRVRPRWEKIGRTWVAFRDTFLGRDAITDSITGREIEPAQPPMGVRLANVETAVARLADQHKWLENHEGRIRALEAARVERVVTQAESAAMWQAVHTLRDDDEQDQA